MKAGESLVLSFDRPKIISGFVYTPSWRRKSECPFMAYKLFIDDRLISEGELANIINDPSSREVMFKQPVKGKVIRFLPQSLCGDSAAIGEFSVVTP